MPPNTTGEARAYPRPLPNPEWLAKRTEEILEPDLPIVDPHHHLWDHPGSRYLLDELLADVNSGHNIAATVFIQCGSGYRTSGPEEMRPIGESEFVRAIAEESDRRGGKTKICAGIVSFADLRLPNVDAVLEGQIAAAGGRFRGIRQIAAHDPAIIGGSSYLPPPGLMDDPKFRRQPLHVREQLPGRQGRVWLSGAVQRLQAAGAWRLRIGKSRSVRRHRLAVLPAGHTPFSLRNKTMSDLPTHVDIHEEGPREG